MSKAARISDVERTATMLDLIRRRYEGDGTEQQMSRSHVVIEEVAPGTGWAGAQRWADVLALSVWPSKGLTLDGFEIKASRADLKRELANLTKHQAVARYCDTWTLVAWDESVLVDGIPDHWGITLTQDGEHARELVVTRKPTPREPEPWPRSFVCSLVRNASEQSPGAQYVARAVEHTRERAREEYRRMRQDDLRHALRPLAELLYGKNDWKWPTHASRPENLIPAVVAKLTEPPLGASAVESHV